MAKGQGRQTLQFDVGQAMLHSLAIEHFYSEHRSQPSTITRRTRYNNVLQSGAMIEKSGLASVLTFLDTPEFHAAPPAAQQQMIFKAMALRLGVDLGDAPAIVPPAATEPPAPAAVVKAVAAEPPAAAPVVDVKSQTGIDGDSREVDKPPMDDNAVKMASKRFKNIGSA